MEKQAQNKTVKTPQSSAPKKTPKAQQYQTPAKVTPGMFVYVDGLIYPEIIKGRQIKAVVGSVNGSDVLAVCLREICLPWSSDLLEVKMTQTMTDGREATNKILEISRKKRQKAEAAQWCNNYAQDGVKQGEAFLPSINELEELFANEDVINASLKVLEMPVLSGWHWSSAELDSYHSWKFSMRNGSRIDDHKYHGNLYVRPVISVKL